MGAKRCSADGAAADSPGSLLTSLESIGKLLEEGQSASARGRLLGADWLTGADVESVPASTVRTAQQWVDAAHEALCGSTPNPLLARNILHRAGDVVKGGSRARNGLA